MLGIGYDLERVPFGYKVAWLAAEGVTPEQLVALLGLVDVERAGWEVLDQAHRSGRIFVPQVIDGWAVAVGLVLEPGAATSVSARTGRAVHHYVSHRVTEVHGWCHIEAGRVQRAFCYLGEADEVQDNEGERTPVEVELGIPGADEAPPGASLTELDLDVDEEVVRAVAAAWSFDPHLLSGRDDEPGWLGRPPAPGVRGLLGSVRRRLPRRAVW